MMILITHEVRLDADGMVGESALWVIPGSSATVGSCVVNYLRNPFRVRERMFGLWGCE